MKHGERAPRSAPRAGPRLVLVLLLLLVVGLPAAIGTAWLRDEVPGSVASGAQPGGTLRGRVLDEDERPLPGRRVEALLVAAGDQEPGPTTTTDADGRFTLELPPFRGHYVVRAGGGEEQRAARPVSFLGPVGEPLPPDELVLRLRPGATLDLAIERADGSPAGGGRWVLEASFGEGVLFGCVPYGLRQEGRVEEGRVRIDGLPPLRGTLSAVLDSGETLELDLRLRAGPNARTIRL